jgi:hypothetical protein
MRSASITVTVAGDILLGDRPQRGGDDDLVGRVGRRRRSSSRKRGGEQQGQEHRTFLQ